MAAMPLDIFLSRRHKKDWKAKINQRLTLRSNLTRQWLSTLVPARARSFLGFDRSL
jgi:hypothetical protein